MGSWVDYGLGSECDDLPAFVVLISMPSNGKPDQGLLARLWGSGFLPSRHQGVKLRSAGDPVLFLRDPEGLSAEARRRWLDALGELNRQRHAVVGDPEIEARIAQYEMACRMQTSVPELVDMAGETESTYQLYGETARKPGTFAANCLLARRLAERGRAVHSALSSRLGSSRQSAEEHRVDGPRRRSGLGGVGARSQAARAARRHARHLGRRVWPHRVLPGRADARELWPRSSRPRVFPMDGRRRREAGHSLRADRRL